MISHQYKCIFIHIPRTAGTAIEEWICGDDWWNIEKETKHLLASQARELYKDHWDSYFKFSFVRNPWDRMVSCLESFEDFFKVAYAGTLDLEGYKKEFGYPLTIENDYRFTKRKDLQLAKHQDHCVYLNILDEELDFIGRFENLRKDIAFIKDRLKIEKDFSFKVKDVAPRRKGKYQDYYDGKSRKTVEDLFKNDIKAFGYEFGEEL